MTTLERMTPWLSALLAVAALSACSKDNGVDATQNVTPGTGQQCAGAGDPACGTTGVCVLGYCRLGCATDGECPQGTLCIGDTPPFGCQLQQDIHCGANQKCEAPLVCGLDNTCRIGCSTSDPCPRNDQTCIDGACYGKLENGASQWSCDGSSKGDYRCEGKTLQVCNVGGLGWVTLDECETAALCQKGRASGACDDPVCSSSEDRCEGSLMKICNADRTEVIGTVCDSAALCTAGLPSKSCKQKLCSPGDLHCNGKTLQTCDSDLDGWETLEACETPALCADSVTAATGTCVAAACKPGDKRCAEANLEACNDGQNGWKVETPCDTPELCAQGLALNGNCAGATCALGEKHCSGYDVMVCNAGRTGFEVQETCANICDGGVCTGDCHPETQQCSGNVLQTCQPDGQWNTGIPCQYVCKNNYCTGACTPGSFTCNGTKLRSCGSDGLWDAGTECPFACVNNACAGICKPGAKQCGGSKVLYECLANGQWNSGSMCEFSCVNGACTAECVPGETACEGFDVRTCQAGGLYGPAVACPGAQKCVGGSCQDPVAMVLLPAGYLIDSTEVTRDWYAAMMPIMSIPAQPSYCDWNTSFDPNANWPPGPYGKHPVVGVDWCDAYAYCRAVGKRLCGKIGGGAAPFYDYTDATKSQWYNACSSGGTYNYPYGGSIVGWDGYDGQKCNGQDKGVGGTLPVGACPDCQSIDSAYAGVFDLSGNVFEWEDSCEKYGGPADYCRMRGGSYDGFNESPGLLRCNGSQTHYRHIQGAMLGFRCCSDP